MPNQTPPELEAKILEMTEQYPAYSYVASGRKARTQKLTPEKRREIASKAALARWAKHKNKEQK